MNAYSAVVTTGIYCRPDCSASPKPSNVRHYLQPAAAEAAGFRACLRCRPYRSAQVLPSDGPDIVCRAVRLITQGALDGATEDDLAARLAVSSRHLRRLFTDHLGATPDQLARSRRVHFARRLLDDTDLTVAEVAFASGFGSVRQLNRACRATFQSSPTELRRRRRKTDRLVADGGLMLRVPFVGALDWEAFLAFAAPRAIAGVETVEGGTYRRTIELRADPGVIELRRGGPDHLLLTAHLPHWEDLLHLVERVRTLGSLDVPVAEAASHLRSDDVLGPLLEARPGLRVPGAWDPFEVGVRAIVGQQVSVAGATTMLGRIVERAGRPVAGLATMGLARLFPTADDVASADLAGLGLTGSRERALVGFARAVAGGEVLLDGSANLEDLTRSLTALPGIGPWTAGYLAMRLGEPDALPTDDLGLIHALEALGHPDGRAALRELAPAWSPWRATAAFHLWTHLATPGSRA